MNTVKKEVKKVGNVQNAKTPKIAKVNPIAKKDDVFEPMKKEEKKEVAEKTKILMQNFMPSAEERIKNAEKFQILTKKYDRLKEKKELLKKLSKKAKVLIELEGEERNVNSMLIKMYTNDTHKEFKTFKGWIAEGHKVKKGEKGFFVWSKKLKATDKTEVGEDDKEFKFFGIAYIFSNAQVEKIKTP